MTEDRIIEADFLPLQPLTLADDVVVFDEARLEQVFLYDHVSGQFILNHDAATHDIEVGTILLSSQPRAGLGFRSYFLRRVTDILAAPGSPTYLRTRPEALSAAILAGSVMIEPSPLNPTDVSTYRVPAGVTPLDAVPLSQRGEAGPWWREAGRTFRVLAPGRESPVHSRGTTDTRHANVGPGHDFVLDTELAPGLSLAGRLGLHVTPSFILDASVQDAGPLRSLEGFKSAVAVSIAADLKLRATASKKGVYRLRLPIETSFAPIAASPLVIVPSLSADLLVTTDVSAGFASTLALRVDAKAGVQYRNGEGWRRLWWSEPRGEFTDLMPGVSGSAQVDVLLHFDADLYGSMGPRIDVQPHLATSVFKVESASGTCTWDFTPREGARAGFSGPLSVLDRRWHYDGRVADARRTESGVRRCRYDDDTRPATPGRVRLSPDGSDGLIVEWGSSFPPSSVGWNYEIARTYDSRSEVGKLRSRVFRHISGPPFLDTGLFAAGTYCYTLRTVDHIGLASPESAKQCASTHGFDMLAPTIPFGLVARARSTGVISLVWLHASDDQGIAAYVVVEASDNTAVADTSDTVINITGLKPNTEYCYNVAAVDHTGNASYVSEEACATTFPVAEAKWRFRMVCGTDNLIDQRLDFDEEFATTVSVLGESVDGHDKRVLFSLAGPYDPENQILRATLAWSTAGQDEVRLAKLVADLSTSDSGEIPTDKLVVNPYTCNAIVRFSRQ